MYSRILVATDGSHTADVALTEAVELAKAHQGELRILHVVDSTPSARDGYSRSHQAREKAVREGRSILAEAEHFAKTASIDAETRLLEIDTSDQRIAQVLAHEASAWPADVIVIGARGERRFAALLLGTVAAELLRVASQVVLLVPGLVA